MTELIKSTWNTQFYNNLVLEIDTDYRLKADDSQASNPSINMSQSLNVVLLWIIFSGKTYRLAAGSDTNRHSLN